MTCSPAILIADGARAKLGSLGRASATAILTALVLSTTFVQAPSARAGADAGLKAGTAAPVFTLPLIANGNGAFDLRQSRGHGVYINFFASWCTPCKREAQTI